MKFPDMHQYITVLFSLLAEFLTPQNPSPGTGGLGTMPMHPCSSFTPRWPSKELGAVHIKHLPHWNYPLRLPS